MEVLSKIPKSPDLVNGENYSFLFEEGLKLIRQLSGKVWTDYNRHDPGITILEVLCYALTEHTLKANLDIQDIVRSGKPAAKNGLFPAEDILPSAPVTLNDYRKLLIDIVGVKNGWLVPVPSNEANDINGLYDIFLELETDSELGDLNSSIIARSITVDPGGGPRDYILEFSFPYWDEEIVSVFREDISILSITSPGSTGIILTTTDPYDENDYFTNLEVTYNTSETVSFGITIKVSPAIGNDPAENAAIETEISSILSEAPGGGPGDSSVLKEFNRKVTTAYAIRNDVMEVVQQNRNLCEDFLTVKAVRIQEIAIHATIKLLKKINIEKYLANVYKKLAGFFDPVIQFESFENLLKQSQHIESIFEGPLLNNGFLTDEALSGKYNIDADQSKGVVFVSDLSHILIETAGIGMPTQPQIPENQILAIESIMISNYIRNRIVHDKAKDCLKLAKPDLYKPRLSRYKSRFTFYLEGVEIPYNVNLVTTLYDELSLSTIMSPSQQDFIPFPEGDILEISDYNSIQYDFPPLYGLADNSLSEITTAPLHKAQVEQLRAYLTVFDHTLASYSNLLYHLNELFSIDDISANTYFKQPLYNIPYLKRILIDFLNSAMTWEDFISDLDNSYQKLLTDIFEPSYVFIDRRNRFLDHILARFGMTLEKFTAYRFSEETNNVSESVELEKREYETSRDLISDKAYILQRYPELSKKRFSAFNYQETAWDSLNIPGLADRLITLSGQRNGECRTLNGEADNFIRINTTGGGLFNFEIIDSSSSPVLEGTTTYPTAQDARLDAIAAIRQGINRDVYYLEQQTVGPEIRYRIGMEHEIPVPGTYLAIHPEPLPDEDRAREVIRRIIRELREAGSGVHVVEHVLLRPDQEFSTAIELNIPQGDPPVAISEPYSFRISIVLPSGYARDIINDGDPVPHYPAHHREEKFRKFAEGIIHDEVPSHIFPHIFWLDSNTLADQADTPSLQNFESRWREWLDAKANPSTSGSILLTLRNNLITVMNSMFLLD